MPSPFSTRIWTVTVAWVSVCFRMSLRYGRGTRGQTHAHKQKSKSHLHTILNCACLTICLTSSLPLLPHSHSASLIESDLSKDCTTMGGQYNIVALVKKRRKLLASLLFPSNMQQILLCIYPFKNFKIATKFTT